MNNKYRRRLAEVMSGRWGLRGAETSYCYDKGCECHALEALDRLTHRPVGLERRPITLKLSVGTSV